MGSKLAEVGVKLDVSGDDLRELKRQRRRDVLTRFGQIIAPVTSVILGILAAEEVYPIASRTYHGYPYIGSAFMMVSKGKEFYPRRSWVGPVILSVALFIIAFAFVATFNTASNDDYFGPTPEYGVFRRYVGAGGVVN